MRFVRKCAALIVASVALLALLARERQQAAQAAQGRWSQVALQLREERCIFVCTSICFSCSYHCGRFRVHTAVTTTCLGRGRTARVPRQQVHHIFETSRYEVRVSEAKPTHCIDAIGLTMYHAVQDHDDYGDTISHQLNASYAESACLIDNYVVNTHEYSIANATSKPHLTHNPAGICTAKHLVRSKSASSSAIE